MVQFDPRLVPTRTAVSGNGRRSWWRLIMRRRDVSDTTALILWGLETSRSQGETIDRSCIIWASA
ncbi:hypothetical protein [Blautia massiliensis (ex Durand et al. 2017)]|uniref:hypothetical protein n=1 Tax=Blautia massiliensis (ex Durand et al. 2017) TaxID=1737424 RepID=UPI0039A2E032